MAEKEALVTDILDIEVEMFLAVNDGQGSSCQNYPESMKMHRKAQFMAWSIAALDSYLKDLQEAVDRGENLMTYKYARMDNLIPPRHSSPLLEKIVSMQYDWQQAFFNNYPNLAQRSRPISSTSDSDEKTSFETYLTGELESYSERTLEILYDDFVEKRNRGINLSEEVYTYMVTSLGYTSLADAEERIL